MELIVKDGSLRSMLMGSVFKGFPHVHERQPYPFGFCGSEPLIEELQTLLRAVGPPKPDGPPPLQIADDDPVGMALTDGDLVNADGLGPGIPGTAEFLPHVLFFQSVDRLAVQMQLSGDILDRGGTATLPNVKGKPLGVERIVGQEGKLLLLHLAAPSAQNAPDLQFEVDARVATGEVADPAELAVVESPVYRPATSADCFFCRRLNWMIRALGSPKIPDTLSSGVNGGKR
jgi:hypothetical protein